MEYLELAPPAQLSPAVQCFWFLRGDLTGAAPQTIVPDGRMEIVLHLGEPFAEVDGMGLPRPQGPALLAGQLMSPLRVQPLGFSDVVGIRLRPAAGRSLFGSRMAELDDSVTPLGSIAPRLAATLADALAGGSEPAARARRIAAALAGIGMREPPPAVRHAVHRLGEVKPPRLADLARELGMSGRTLERRVRAETGLTPTMLRRVLRFRRAFRMLDRRPAGAWGEVAARAGYYDQAHLIREFRKFAGAAPAAFLEQDPQLARALTSAEESAA